PVRHDPRAEVVDHHVAAARQLAHQLDSARIAQIDRDTALAAVQVAEQPAASLRGVGRIGPFDLDDVGAVIGEHARRHRPGDDPGKVEHADPFENSGVRWLATALGWAGYGGEAVTTPAIPKRRRAAALQKTEWTTAPDRCAVLVTD